MRLWSLHPQYLDRQGLLAAWREGLLAQKVLLGQTKGYTRHPQLERFRAAPDPIAAIRAWLEQIRLEAAARGYNFDPAKIGPAPRKQPKIPVTRGQLEHERAHLLGKLAQRDPARHEKLLNDTIPTRQNPVFTTRPGPVEPWEKHGGANVRATRTKFK